MISTFLFFGGMIYLSILVAALSCIFAAESYKRNSYKAAAKLFGVCSVSMLFSLIMTLIIF